MVTLTPFLESDPAVIHSGHSSPTSSKGRQRSRTRHSRNDLDGLAQASTLPETVYPRSLPAEKHPTFGKISEQIPGFYCLKTAVRGITDSIDDSDDETSERFRFERNFGCFKSLIESPEAAYHGMLQPNVRVEVESSVGSGRCTPFTRLYPRKGF